MRTEQSFQDCSRKLENEILTRFYFNDKNNLLYFYKRQKLCMNDFVALVP